VSILRNVGGVPQEVELQKEILALRAALEDTADAAERSALLERVSHLQIQLDAIYGATGRPLLANKMTFVPG